MAVTIGRKVESDFTDPLGLLGDCHRRIEYFLNLLITVTRRARGRQLNREQREALEAALRYFRQAAPKHTLDEEESLFPRMRASQSNLAQTALDLLDTLHQDHTLAGEIHKRVEGLAGQWLAAGELSEGQSHRLAGLLEDLSEIYRKHIAVEDTEIFPLAGRVLSRADIETVGREMAARRGVDLSKRGF